MKQSDLVCVEQRITTIQKAKSEVGETLQTTKQELSFLKGQVNQQALQYEQRDHDYKQLLQDHMHQQQDIEKLQSRLDAASDKISQMKRKQTRSFDQIKDVADATEA